ncbi:hypothetical protein B5F37_11000 [Drancourtella sp. An210]|nr:hypothetical protein B5F37_11000 [Drancourtella sp. An210]
MAPFLCLKTENGPRRVRHPWYNSLGKYQIQSRQKEQFYTKDKTALNVILSNCTNSRTVSRETYGDCIFPESRESSYFL